MSFGDNIRFLRTNREMTQEELAERMAVSRQTVSKWESDNAYPEMEKLIALCELFSCTMDALVRGDLTIEKQESRSEEAPAVPQSEKTETAHRYDAHMNRRAILVSAGVGMILYAFLFLFFFSGILRSSFDIPYQLADSIALIFSCALILAAIIVLIVQGFLHQNFMLAHPKNETPYTEKQIEAFRRKFPLYIGIAVACICIGLFGATFFMVLLPQWLGWREVNFTFYALCILFSALGVPMLVWTLMQRSKYNIEKYEKKAKKCPKKQ